MIKVNNLLKNKWGLKVAWFAAGKQDEVKMIRESKMWSNKLIRPANTKPGDVYDQLFGKAKKLNDLILKDAPLLFISPAPSVSGQQRSHDITISNEHREKWEKMGPNMANYMNMKFDCHITQQQIDTFMVVVTTIHNSDYEVIRQYLTKFIGNYLFISAMSGTLNPMISEEETDNYGPLYDPTGMDNIKPGQRKNMKVIPAATWRLDHMVQLCHNNKGDVNTYTMGKNYINPHKDRQASADQTPVLVTALTYPQFPTSDKYKCSAFAANSAHWMRCAKLMNTQEGIDKKDDLSALRTVI